MNVKQKSREVTIFKTPKDAKEKYKEFSNNAESASMKLDFLFNWEDTQDEFWEGNSQILYCSLVKLSPPAPRVIVVGELSITVRDVLGAEMIARGTRRIQTEFTTSVSGDDKFQAVLNYRRNNEDTAEYTKLITATLKAYKNGIEVGGATLPVVGSASDDIPVGTSWELWRGWTPEF